MKKALPAAILLLILGLTGCASVAGESGYQPQLEFEAQTVAGEKFASSSFSGKDTLIWFWTPWCAICAQESADIKELQAANPEVQFIGIAGYGTRGEMQDFVDRTGTDQLVHLVDTNGELWANFQVPLQPSIVVLNQDGAAQLHIGPATREVAQQLLDSILED
jgi:thiol-disulfide isomerase/thioredoxin